MKEEIKVYLIEVLLKHKFAFIFSVCGFIFAFLILIIGFLKTLLLFVFITVGWILGTIYDNGNSINLRENYSELKSKFNGRF